VLTITTDASTDFRINGRETTITGLSAGDTFQASFNGSSSESLATIASSAPLRVDAQTPPPARQVYAFVGTVTSVDDTRRRTR
jgi:hypothetical protein